MAESRVSSITAEVIATACNQARVSAIAAEVLVSVEAAAIVPTSSENAAIVMVISA